MDRERFQRLADLFEHARQLPAAEREMYLHEHVGNDTQLRSDVLTLLRHHDETGADGSLSDHAAPIFISSAIRTQAPDAGKATTAGGLFGMSERVGDYRIISMIAEGGMGVVYLAEQEQPRRLVALKVIKPGMDSAAVIARFEQEREALAVIDHPNVAKVLDAGTTDRGLPYFVMEHVRGIPITEFCDQHRLRIEDRLKLFISVCDAVQHAHTKGVIHRDLKPSNILVVEAEAQSPAMRMPGLSAIPKVIDFGIAKALNRRLTERTIFTEQGQMIGTPEYMSPEQAGGMNLGSYSSLDIDTRADVYSLGVVLYELLTGALPFDSQTLRAAGFTEIQRIIREVEPRRPSAKFLSPQISDPDAIARSRNTDVRMLARRLVGDLDWIVMKCLEKDRERRYDAVNGLVADLRRHLNNEPVLAGPPSTVYRLRKFIRRNRVPVVAGSLVAAALMIATVVSITYGIAEAEQRRLAEQNERRALEQQIRAEREAERAIAAEHEAQQRARELQQVVEFQAERLGDIDVPLMGVQMRHDLLERASDAMMSRGIQDEEREAHLQTLHDAIVGVNFTDAALAVLDKNILKHALRAVSEQFSDQPLVEARLLATLGSAYMELGLLAQAEGPMQRTLAIRHDHLGEEHPDTLIAMRDLGELMRRQARYVEAEEYLSEALGRLRLVLGDDHEVTIYAMGSAAALLHKTSSAPPNAAAELYAEAIERARAALGNAHSLVLTLTHNMGQMLREQGRYADADVLLHEALEVARRIHGNEHSATLTVIHSIATLREQQGRFDEAEDYFRQVLESRRRVLGDAHPQTLVSLNAMGYVLESQGKFADATTYHEQAIATSRLVVGERHPTTLAIMNNLGMVLREMGRLDEAEPHLTLALDGFRETFGEDHPSTLTLLNNVGLLRKDQGLFEEAKLHYLASLEGRRHMLGDDHPATLVVLNNLGFLFKDMGDLEAARAYWQDSLDQRRRVHGNEHPSTLLAISNMGMLLRLLGEYDEAEHLGREAVRLAREVLAEDHWRTGLYLCEYGQTLAALERFEEAEQHLLAGTTMLIAAFGESHAQSIAVAESLADLYGAWHEHEPDAGYDVHATEWRARLAKEDEIDTTSR